MRHLDDGAIRRLYDEPEAVAAADRAHLAACARCQRTYALVAAYARAASGLLAAPATRVDPVPALHTIRQRLAAEPAPRATGLRLPWRRPLERTTPMYQYNTSARRLARPTGALVAAAALAGAFALTPAGSLAASVLTIFEPQQFTAVPVTSGDLQSLRDLPDLSSYGTMAAIQNPTTQSYASAAEAAHASGLTVFTPATLPAGVPSTVTYSVMSRGIASFTFDAARARAAAAKAGKTLPDMPAGLDGSALRLSVGPIVVATYGGAAPANGGDNPASAPRGAPAPQARDGGKAAVAQVRKDIRPRAAAAGSGDLTSIPSLVVVQAPRPRLTTTNGVTVVELEDYLSRQPGVSSQVAAEIKSIGDPSSTLPIPIPVDRFNAQHVTLQDGADSLVVGDNTGIGSGIIWQKDGAVYAVAGALTQDQVVAVANALHAR